MNSVFLDVLLKITFLSGFESFLSRVSILTRDIDIAIVSVRPSVRLSVCPSVCLSVRHVPVFYGNDLTYCHCFFTTL